MKGVFYRLLVHISRVCGTWIFHLVSSGIAAGYFVFCPQKAVVSIRFYRVLFPQKTHAYHVWCTWKQYQNFTTVFLDRFVLPAGDELTYTYEGWDHLETCLDNHSGAVILMSHLGNWEIAAHLMKKREDRIRLLLYMGRHLKEQIESIQKDDLRNSGIRIVAVDSGESSPFDILDGIRFLQDGGMVSMTGDQIWHQNQRAIPVTFLGHEVRFPGAPHVLAMLSGAPLLIFFSFRTGKNRYHFSLSEPIAIQSASRGDRSAAIGRSAQRYADLLEKALRKNPLEWYHFEPFLGKRLP